MFSSLNPSGHYQLNLSYPPHRELVKILLVINKQNYDKIVKSEVADRSPDDSKSLFRNGEINKAPLKWTPGFILPQSGQMNFDFVYMPPARNL